LERIQVGHKNEGRVRIKLITGEGKARKKWWWFQPSEIEEEKE
jgi:hypothetical protein